MKNNSVIGMYAEHFANWITGGSLINRDKLSSIGLKIAYNKIITKKRITKAWCICSIPVTYSHNLSEGIRKEMFKVCPNVQTIIHTYNVPANVNVHNRVFTQYMSRSAAMFDEYAEYYTQMREDEKLTGKTVINEKTGRKMWVNTKQLMRIRDQKDSYTYVYKRVLSGCFFTETYYFVQASARTQRELEQYAKRLASILKSENIVFYEVKGTLYQYLSNYCPAAFKQNEVKRIAPMLFSEENLALQMPYRNKGLIGKNGILLGLEWQSKLPFMISFTESSAGQVVLLDGKTGCGKTYMAFNIAQGAIGYGIHCSAIDIKGQEWSKMSAFVDTKVISFDNNHPNFVNTLRLDDLRCTKENAREMYDNAVNGTVTILSIMTNLASNEGNITDLKNILTKSVIKVMSNNNVVADNPATFVRTKNLTYLDVINVVSELQGTNIYNDSQREVCNLIIMRCSSFLSDERYSEMMKNEITVQDILETPLVIYSFNKNVSGELDLFDSIRVFMVQFLDSKKHEIRKNQKLHTFAFYEELQRCVSFTTLMNYISSRVTGSRSSNVSVFLLMNAISALNDAAMSQIKSNITTKIIGKVNSEDIDVLVDKYDCKPIENYMKLINESSYYNQCFAIMYDTGVHADKAIFKTILPDYMEREFRTRDRLAV